MSCRPLAGLAVAFFVATLVGPTAAVAAGEVLLWATVPSQRQPQGEVRLVREGKTRTVQTLLHSKLLHRVVGRIAEREKAAWPAGSSGHADSQRYVTALRQAQRRVSTAARARERTADDDRRVGLLVEFELGPGVQRVVFSDPQIEGSQPPRRVTGRETLATLELSRGYVRDNMRRILIDSVGITPDEAELRIPERSSPSVEQPDRRRRPN